MGSLVSPPPQERFMLSTLLATGSAVLGAVAGAIDWAEVAAAVVRAIF